MRLEELAIRSGRLGAADVAVVGPGESVTYGAMNEAADRAASALFELGVRRGDRVAVWAPKGARVVTAMQAAMRCGACYVPIDPKAPRAAVERILDDCGVKALVTAESTLAALDGSVRRSVPTLLVAGEGGTIAWSELDRFPVRSIEHGGTAEDLAYILYTSGSTGEPKGVSISHRAALAFVEWAASTLGVVREDRLSNHAPFHFDLSVLDIYAAFAGGARVVVVPEGAAYAPAELVAFVRTEQISIWYSVPSALRLMMEQGGFLEERPPALRAILFAGSRSPSRVFARCARPSATFAC